MDRRPKRHGKVVIDCTWEEIICQLDDRMRAITPLMRTEYIPLSVVFAFERLVVELLIAHNLAVPDI